MEVNVQSQLGEQPLAVATLAAFAGQGLSGAPWWLILV